ncbi:MAG: isoleucine--tRNA ligase [Candidatus Nealsonbacteria bacterium]
MNLNFNKIEEEILKFWQENKIFEKLRKKNQGKNSWSFLDGPITANNPMGVHHAWGRTYKDVFQRHKAIQGFDQRFQNGFDCQGLWVEVEVEKELGFKTKKDIENYGIAEFIEKCKERVKKYSEIQTKQSIRLGQWMDWKNSYYTMSDENNYAIWHFLKICKEKELLYKGRDVVPWCTRCGTAISQHEILTEEYQEITHKSIFFKLPVLEEKNKFFLVWTTTPWTLPANVALAVNPELEYAEIKNKKGTFLLLKSKANLVPEGKIVKTMPGKELEGLKYKGLFDELQIPKKEKDSHKVLLWDEVSEEEGTGIVHIAPGCGEEDFKLSKETGIPVIDPTNEESRYKEGFGFLTGKLVAEVRDIIFEDLEKKKLVFKIEDYLHRYPTCWRCKSELIFRLVDEWYISMDKLRKPLMDIAKKIKWIPSFGLERELDWLKNMHDWLISKKRYWGLCLPIFECECGNFEVIGSKEELKERAVSGFEEFEKHSPHRPWADNVKIKCQKCGKEVSRIPDVGNPWLDAGIVPFSTMGYFEDKDYWKKWFPADFICESFPGQFKNWFYSLLVMSAVLEKTNPFKVIFGYASVRDENDEEMHKSKGNAIWFDEAVSEIGVDVMRWMYVKQNPIFNLRFGYKAAEETKRKLLTLWNSFLFFLTYADKKEIKGDVFESKNLLDKWIDSRFNSLVEKVGKSLDSYNSALASSAIENFFIEDLSLWYIRRSRKRFHEKDSKKEVCQTLYFVLLNLAKLMAPMTPFLAEEMYLKLKTKEMLESVHLCDWLKTDKKNIDSELEKKMEEIRGIVAKALAKRASLGIKVRQPLGNLQIIKGDFEKELLELIKEEVNVKKITFGKELKLDEKITANLKEEGVVREIVRNIQQMRKKAGCKPENDVLIQCFGGEKTNKFLKKNKKNILKEIKAKDFKLEEKNGKDFDYEKEMKVFQESLWLGIKRI